MSMLYRLTLNNDNFKEIYKLTLAHFKGRVVSNLTVGNWLLSLRNDVKYAAQWVYLDSILKYYH